MLVSIYSAQVIAWGHHFQFLKIIIIFFPKKLAAGCTQGSWEKKVVCLSILSVEDVAGVYMIGILITCVLLFGCGSFLIYCQIHQTKAI